MLLLMLPLLLLLLLLKTGHTRGAASPRPKSQQAPFTSTAVSAQTPTAQTPTAAALLLPRLVTDAEHFSAVITQSGVALPHQPKRHSPRHTDGSGMYYSGV